MMSPTGGGTITNTPIAHKRDYFLRSVKKKRRRMTRVQRVIYNVLVFIFFIVCRTLLVGKLD